MNALSDNVLVLNKAYTPIAVTTARDAFVKLYTNLAEVVTVEEGTYQNYNFSSWAEISELKKELEDLGDFDDLVFSEKLTLMVPRVIRVLHYEKVPRHTVKLTRRAIYARDDNTCQYCGGKFKTSDLNIDHVVPKSKGGGNTWENLVCSCFKCNSKKASRTLNETGMKLIRKPFKPSYNASLNVHIRSPKYYSWKAFISEKYWTVDIGD